jgi:hypothetical protein
MRQTDLGSVRDSLVVNVKDIPPNACVAVAFISGDTFFTMGYAASAPSEYYPNTE